MTEATLCSCEAQTDADMSLTAALTTAQEGDTENESRWPTAPSPLHHIALDLSFEFWAGCP
jgi:hypothetical protein